MVLGVLGVGVLGAGVRGFWVWELSAETKNGAPRFGELHIALVYYVLLGHYHLLGGCVFTV